MREILNRFESASRHLKIVDDFMIDNDPEYQRMEDRLIQCDGYDDFCRELYFGGSKSRGNPPKGSRQMILSDIFQYIITSRGVYLAARGSAERKRFIKIVMHLINQWLLMDSLGPQGQLALRRNLMITLRNELTDDYFFENGDSYFIDKYNEAHGYQGDLIPGPPNTNPPSGRVLDHYDSLFPKVRGGPIEVLVYLYLFQRRLGFVVSALTQQRLLSGNKVTRPPDIFLLRKKGEILGLEIGRGKETQSADFSMLTGIPTFSVDLIAKQPFRCDGCGKWITYCQRVIELYSEQGIPANHKHILRCSECPYFDEGNCPDIMCYTKATNRYGTNRKARYHLRCLNPGMKQEILRDDAGSLVSYYPLVAGLKDLPED